MLQHRLSAAGPLSPETTVSPPNGSAAGGSGNWQRTRTISGQFLRTDAKRFSGRSLRSGFDESRKGSREERDVLVNALRRNSFNRVRKKLDHVETGIILGYVKTFA